MGQPASILGTADLNYQYNDVAKLDTTRSDARQHPAKASGKTSVVLDTVTIGGQATTTGNELLAVATSAALARS